MGIIFPSFNKGRGARFDLAEKSGRWLWFLKVNRETVEVEKGLVEGIDVMLVVDVRVQVSCPFQRCGGRPGGCKVDQRKGNAVNVESGREESVEFLESKRATERSGIDLLRGHCGLKERDAHQHHPDLHSTLKYTYRG